MELICDDREHKICLLAKNKYDNVYVEHLTIGDFIIGYRREGTFIPLVIVERKTWPDLAASLKDGRVENVKKLRSYREETGARIAYLMEGTPSAKAAAGLDLIEGIPYKSLRAHLDHLLFKDSIIELHSASPANSLARLLELSENLKIYTKDLAPKGEVDGISAAKVKIVATDEQIADGIWGAFEGISLASARAFRGLTIAALYRGEIKQEDLSELQVGSRRFGTKRAESILNSLEKEQTLERILRAVPRISTKRARAVIDCMADGVNPIPIANLFQDWNRFRPLVEGKIGKAGALSMEKYLALL